MALDWSREISFSGMKKKKAGNKSQALPDKKYINLVKSDKKELDIGKTVLIGILVALIVAAFAKFAVFDVLGSVSAKEAELATQKNALEQASTKIKDYDAVLTEYGMYASVDTEGTYSAQDIIDLIDRKIAPSAKIASVDYSGDKIALVLSGMNLSQAGALSQTLSLNDMVRDVSVSTAAAKDNTEDVTTTMTILLNNGEGE